MSWSYEYTCTRSIPVSSTSVAHIDLTTCNTEFAELRRACKELREVVRRDVRTVKPRPHVTTAAPAKKVDEAPARRVLRRFELAPATPWYVWAIVALAFIILMAWLTL
jgi:hypothetical protein